MIATIALADKLTGTLQGDGSVLGGKTLTLDVERSSDGGTNWLHTAGFGWTSYGAGGYHVIDKNGVAVDNPDPDLSFNPTAYIGNLFRLKMTAPQTITFGGTIEVT